MVLSGVVVASVPAQAPQLLHALPARSIARSSQSFLLFHRGRVSPILGGMRPAPPSPVWTRRRREGSQLDRGRVAKTCQFDRQAPLVMGPRIQACRVGLQRAWLRGPTAPSLRSDRVPVMGRSERDNDIFRARAGGDQTRGRTMMAAASRRLAALSLRRMRATWLSTVPRRKEMGDLGVGQALGQQSQDLPLTAGEVEAGSCRGLRHDGFNHLAGT